MKKILSVLVVCLAFNTLFAQTMENALIDAVTYYNLNNYTKAEQLFKAILAKDGGNDAANYYLSMIARSRNDAEKAEAYAWQAARLDPDNYWYQTNLADIYARTSRQELAIEIYNGILEKNPNKTDLYYNLVELYISQKQWDNALETLDKADVVFGKTEQAALVRFQILANMGRMEDAVGSLKQYNEEYSSPTVLSTLGDMSTYSDSTALAYYNEALEIDANFAAALFGRVEVYRQSRRYGEYFNELNSIVANTEIIAAIKAEYLNAVVEKTDPNFVNRFKKEFSDVLKNLLTVHPDDLPAMTVTGAFYNKVHEVDEAERYFGRAVELNPQNVMTWARYVDVLMDNSKWEKLSETATEAFGKFPSEIAFLEYATVGEYNLRNYGRVIEICDMMLNAAPKDSTTVLRAWSTKGDMYHSMGDKKNAYKSYDIALKINPADLGVLNNYAYFLSEDGKKLKKAAAMSKKTVTAEPDNATFLDTYAWILFLQGKPAEAKPYFKHAMLYGGKESAVILDHYAEVLYALKEYDLAFVYWSMAMKKNDGTISGLEEKIAMKKAQMKK